jgi:hypothetical protein
LKYQYFEEIFPNALFFPLQNIGFKTFFLYLIYRNLQDLMYNKHLTPVC